MVAPGLRFKQFKNQWASNKLEALVDSIQSGKSKDRAEDGKFPLFGSTGAIGMTNAPEYSGIAILIARVGANAGSKYLVDGNYSVTDNTLILRLKGGNDYDFFSNLLEYRKLNKLTFGSGQPLVTGGLLKQLEIKSPDPIEQTKIANFLTAVDAKISQLTKKHELLTSYKKGVMQKIFNQELRFKDNDGREFPEREEKNLGDICSITTGKLDANAMTENGEYRFYTCAKEYYRIDNYAFDTNALLVSGNGANVGYIHHYKGKFNAYQRTYVLDKFDENIIFIKFFLDSFLHIRIFKEAKEGNTPYIVMGTLTEMLIQLPTLEEQTKIANFLTAIDDKITNVKSQLEAAKEYKQGLLQQMFV